VFERFTDRARRTVVLAQEEARLLGHGYIGTEHLLLGLIHDDDAGDPGDTAARALLECGVTLETVRASITEIIGPGENLSTEHIPFTPRAKNVLELSLREALQLRHNYIGTEHILLGITREGAGGAVRALLARGVDLQRLRQRVLDRADRSWDRSDSLSGGGQVLGERLQRIQESLERIERRLDALE
jgi:ATP-dependent Clp protease ATP-binding subunit ClpA